LMTLQPEQWRLKRCFCTGGCKACSLMFVNNAFVTHALINLLLAH